MSHLAAFASSAINTERISRDGAEYIIKTFEVTSDADAETLIKADFKVKKYLFSHQSTDKNEVTIETSKEVKFTREITTQTNDTAVILKNFEPYIECEENGMTGRAYIDPSTIVTEVAGYTKSSYTISDTKEFGGFRYNDPSGVPRTTVKDGHTLNLVNINWIVTGTDLVGDSLIPSQYKAVASYSATATRTVPTGYITTVTYTGTISKTVVEKVIYTITYRGEKIPDDFMWLFILGGVLLAAMLVAGLIFIVITVKKDVEIYNQHGDSYNLIGREWINYKKPTVDLLPYLQDARSKSYLLVLSKRAARELLNKEILIRFDDRSLTRKVDSDKIYIKGE